jgi:hypothetical protein
MSMKRKSSYSVDKERERARRHLAKIDQRQQRSARKRALKRLDATVHLTPQS